MGVNYDKSNRSEYVFKFSPYIPKIQLNEVSTHACNSNYSDLKAGVLIR